MQKLVKEYLDELNKKQKKNRRVYVVMLLLVVMVVGGVIGSLTQYGVAMTGAAECGIEEHRHSDACYSSTLLCGLEESAGHVHEDTCYQTESTLTCELEESESTEESEGHTHDANCYTGTQTLICEMEEREGHGHTGDCYESQISCGLEEHTHTDECYKNAEEEIDTNADVENADVWNEQYRDVEWTGNWNEDLVTAARMQIGYEESSRNYSVAEDGSHKGYTRYGQFAEDIYADWDAAFVNFCIYYAGMEESGIFPDETDTARWREEFSKVNEQNEEYSGCLTDAREYTPKAGDIIFFSDEEDEAKNEESEKTAAQMGIISSYDNEKNEIQVIEGNSGDEENQVKENKYRTDDSSVIGYLKTSELEKEYKEETSAKEEDVITPEEDQNQENVITRYDYQGEDVHVIVTLTDPSDLPDNAELVVTPVTLSEEAEGKLEEEARKESKDIENMLAYDITFMVDGVEIQPGASVKVSITIPEAAEGQKMSVFHVGENNEVEDMGGNVDEDKNIVFETPHFSTYVVTLEREAQAAGTGTDSGTGGGTQSGSGGAIEYSKTAHVTNWDERKYQIDITATSKAEEKTTSNTFMVFDTSGSMNYSINYDGSTDSTKFTTLQQVNDTEENSKYKNIKNNLNPNKVYYYGNKMVEANNSNTENDRNNKFPSYPMMNYNGVWYYYDNVEDSKGGYAGTKGDPDSADRTGNEKWCVIDNESEVIIYEWSSRISKLKEIVSKFIKESKNDNNIDKCRIGLASFSGHGFRYAKMANVKAYDETLLQCINRLYGNGGTQPAEGLKQIYKDNQNKTAQYIILFSDGRPEVAKNDTGTYEQNSAAAKKETEEIAKKLKEEDGITIFTVGFGLNIDDAGNNTELWLKEKIASEDCAYTANNEAELERAFEQIRKMITGTVDVLSAEITDVIDPRFLILDDNGVPITPDREEIKNGKGIYLEYNGGTVYYDSQKKVYYVKWINQTIPKVGAWHEIINVIAKEEYIGGNNIPTNVSPDSKIHTEKYGDFELPKPHVNVKSEFQVNNKQVTIFKGDKVPTEKEVLDALFGNEDAKKYSDALTQMGASGDSKQVYTQLGLDKFNLTWYKDENCTQLITKEAMGNDTPSDTQYYYLKVTYNPGKPTVESNKNTILEDKVYIAGTKIGTGADIDSNWEVIGTNSGLWRKTETEAEQKTDQKYKDQEFGVYKINVISGKIRITKILDKPSAEEQTFSFTVKKDGEDFETITIVIPSGVTRVTFSGDQGSEKVLKDLARGSYTITENAAEGYGLKDVSIDKDQTDCENQNIDNTVSFVIGNKDTSGMIGNSSDKNVITPDYTYNAEDGGRQGAVEFTNKEVIADDWIIVKRSANSEDKLLAGAVFRLSSKDNGGSMEIESADIENEFGRVSVGGNQTGGGLRPINDFYGISGEDGRLVWYLDEEGKQQLEGSLPTGEYILTEIKAPIGYVLSSVKWTLNILDGKLVDITSSDLDEKMRGDATNSEDERKIISFYYKDEIIYDLPSAGGRGIYWYMCSGILLMAGAALMTYRNKRKEVQRS